MNERERLSSRLGFIMLSAGCAIGCGNVWKFPWMCGQNGGGSFMLLYILCLLVLGLPVMIMEFAVGRAAQASPVTMYQRLEKPGHKWGVFGVVSLIGNIAIMAFYTVVTGWILYYFVKFLTGQTENLGFVTMITNPGVNVTYLAVTVIVAFGILCFNLQGGLERVTKVMMIILLAIMVILAINSIMTEGSGEGLRFYLIPDFGRMAETGVANVVVGAMNQAFFTLSLGIGAMEIFGSYMSDEHTLPGEAVRICALDTFVALMAGTIIFPACFTFGVTPDNGPSLIFQTLPPVFINMAGGRFWGALFFLFMIFASFSTVLAVFENILAICMDTFGWSRTKASVVNGILLLVLSLPCVFGYNIWSDFHPILGKDVLDSEDFLVSNLLLPIGSLVYLLFCVTKWGWGFDKYLAEANKGTGLRFARWLKPYFQWVLPILIVIILLQGLL